MSPAAAAAETQLRAVHAVFQRLVAERQGWTHPDHDGRLSELAHQLALAHFALSDSAS